MSGPGQDAKPGASIDAEQGSFSSAITPRDLSSDEEMLLDILVACGGSRSVSQLSAQSGLEREPVMAALEGLRGKGLVTRLNTLVESYAARFPGIDV